MPTTRLRHQITETDDIAAAIERALEIELALRELTLLADDHPPGYLDALRAGSDQGSA